MKMLTKMRSITAFAGFMLLPVACSSVDFSDLLPGGMPYVMTTGGDDRIIIPEGAATNKYLTGPVPKNQTIMRSSSTSCSPSVHGFLAAQQLYDLLRNAQNNGNAARCFEYAMDNIHDRMKLYWGANVSRPCAVITTPSGTDAEMIAALAALGRNKAWGDVEKKQERLVTNIVVANGEVGTGTMAAAGMRHFSNITPAGKKVTANSLIQGVAQDAVEAVGLRFREDRSGIIALEKLESTIQKALQQAIDKEGRIAILHVMHVSKTGLNGPSAGFVSAMKKQYGDNLIVVVDAAHLRMDGSIASKWLDAGCWVMMTGSKFLGGASFSGVLLIPDHDADLLAQIEPQKIPAGLGDYFTPADCDRRFVHLRAALPNWYNVGLALRWETALAEAGRFYAIEPSHRDRGIATWAQGMRNIIRLSKNAQLLDDAIGGLPDEAFDELVGKCNTVVSFALTYVGGDGKRGYMNTAQLRKVYELMAQDLRPLLPDLTIQQSVAAKTGCLIGQPVQIGTMGQLQSVLRVAISAPELFKTISFERLDPAALVDGLLADDEVVVQKLDLIVANWDKLSKVK